MTNRRFLSITLVLLMGILACAVPGLPSASEPAPTDADTILLDQMVAETVAAVIAITREAAPAVASPAVNTATPAPVEDPAAGESALSAEGDGTILFVDELARYQLNVPPGWLPVRINQQEYYDAFSLPAASTTAVQQALMDIKSLDPHTFRLFIYDLQDGHLPNGVITTVTLSWDPQAGISLEDAAGIQQAAEALPLSTPGLTVASYSIAATASGIPIGVILCDVPGKSFDGTDVDLFQKQVYLNLPAGKLVISFSTEQNFKDATLPFLDTMVETIRVNP